MFLNTHSYYSLRYGTVSPRQLIAFAKENGISAMALTDINTTSACLDFVRLAQKEKIKPLIGVDFRNSAQQRFVTLAKNNQGFQNINAYLSEFLHNPKLEIPERCKFLPHTYVIYPFSQLSENEIKNLNENEFVGLSIEDIFTYRFSSLKTELSKLVILHTSSFRDKHDFNSHRLLRAIDNNCLLSKLPKSQEGKETHLFISEEKLKGIFRAYPEIIENTQSLIKQCNIDFNFDKDIPNNQKSYTGNEALDLRLLRKLTYEGLPYRYPNPDATIYERIEKELDVIGKKSFVSYFLINWKILKYARSKGYFYVGRGSGANSIVAYLLRITDVDPVELDLYFERFINLYRQNPPDFDIDFSWKDRDDVTEFIFKRFKNTALITVYNTFKYRASVRELGKVFGLPKLEIDKLCSGRYNPNNLDHLSKLVLTYAKRIEGFPNYLGIHAGGIIISEKPIHYYTATFMPPKGFATTQFDMVVAEDIGLYKFDILSQRGLGKIKEAVEIVEYNHNKSLDIHNIKRFIADERIKDMLRNAKAIGCFYVESPAMRMLLKKLRTDDFLGLVAASSVIRPGASKFGMRDYILRTRFPEKRKEAHPVLLNIMPETYGVMVYQEDVIKVAHFFGDLSLAESDVLRRGMSGKFRSREEFLKVKEKFFENCKKNGKPPQLTLEVWQQIESFAGYAFAKGHSASYAVESYQSLFLKCYYPLEYMVATINNFGGFYKTELYVHEARMHGGNILPPCVNKSRIETVIYDQDIYIGFMFLHSFEEKTSLKLLKEREQYGPYQDLDDFLERVPISMEQIRILIRINAFRFTGKNKRELLWESQLKINKVTLTDSTAKLFKEKPVKFIMPKLPCTPEENAFDEIELLGFPLSSPFNLLKNGPVGPLRARHLPNYIGQKVTIEGYLVTVKQTETSKGNRMYFGNFIDLDGDFIDTVHFPPVPKHSEFRGTGIYQITGKVLEEFDCVSIEVSKMDRMPIIEDPRYAPPRTNKPKQISSANTNRTELNSNKQKPLVTRNYNMLPKSFYNKKTIEK